MIIKDKTELEKYERLFQQNGWWEDYRCKLYEYYSKEKDIDVLVKFLMEDIGVKKKKETVNQGSACGCMGYLDFKNVKNARVRCNQETGLYDVESETDIDIEVGGGTPNYEVFGDGKRFGYKKKKE